MPDNKPKRILIAEDEKAYSRALVLKLQNAGFEAESVENGEEALAAIKSGNFDLVLSDLVMPKMDGIEMAQKLRMDEWGKDAKIIILTNLSDMDKTQQALENNIFQYIIKTDSKIEDVVMKVKEFIG